MKILRQLLLLLALCLLSQRALAQYPDSTRPHAISFSGVLFGHYQYRADDGGRDANRFDVERVYLTARAPLGERASVRFTTDLFQHTGDADEFYRGWVIRAKYAYVQYDLARSGRTPTLAARLGMLHTVVIEHLETFWPRWISPVPEDRFGFFSSADLGVAVEANLPRSLGGVYATITNGPGYTSREIDRFKDVAARVSLTPLASRSTGWLRSLTLTAWGYKGALASRFVEGGTGQVGAVTSSLQRDRWGLFAGLRDPRLTVGVEHSMRLEEGELGNNTSASPRILTDSTGRIVSGFAIVRPFQLADSASSIPLALLARWDEVTPNTDQEARARLIIAGVAWDLTSRLSVSLDYQALDSRNGSSQPESKTYFLHVFASF
ncbi:MAG TPA: hypothetical protein VJ803_00475 [Gemmatimonadaceae bacterium]|nr:hypothetical protein [Gemmatimonadaceae bacterium]